MKRIVLAITLYISCMVVDYLVHYLNNRKKSSSPTTTQNSESYVVSCPASVKYVYMTIFALEIILFGVFLFCLLEFPKITNLTNQENLCIKCRITGNENKFRNVGDSIKRSRNHERIQN